MKKSIVVLGKAELKNGDAKPSQELVDAVSESNVHAGRFVYGPQQIVALALRAERRLERSGLPQANRVSFEATFRPAGPFAKAYKFSSSSRSVTLRRATKGWVLVEIKDVTLYPAQDERVEYRATPAQIEEVQRRSVADLTRLTA